MSLSYYFKNVKLILLLSSMLIYLFCMVDAYGAEELTDVDINVEIDTGVAEGEEIIVDEDISLGEEFQDIIWSPEESDSVETKNKFEFPVGRLGNNISLSGYIKNETAFRYHTPSAFTKILNILQIEPRLSLTSSLSLYMRGWAYVDMAYYLESIDTISVRKGPDSILSESLTPSEVDALTIENVRNVKQDKFGAKVKELYIDYNSYFFDLRVGRQIIRWGVVEGARVTDEINPLDFSEMILRDVDDRYVPLLIAKADFYMPTNTNLELLFIPELTFHKPAPDGSHWEQLELFDGIVFPEENLHNSEYAVKLTQYLGSYSIAASYFYTWDDFPTSFREINNLGQFGISPEIEFMQRYKRVRSVGLTVSGDMFNNPVGAEIAYLTGKHFGIRLDGTNSTEPVLSGGALEMRYLKYTFGVDFLFFGADTAVQFVQQFIPSHKPELNLIPDKRDTVWGFSIRKRIIYQTMFPSLLVLYFQNDNDILFRPKVEFAVGERTLVSVGADIFEGKVADEKDGKLLPGEFHFIGFFDNNDRIYMDMKYLF